jgi:DNA repair protein RadC
MLIDHSNFKNIKILKADDAVEILNSIRKNLEPFELDKEYLYTIGLTRRSTIKYIDLCSVGTLTGTLAEPREIFRMAIHKAANSIILSHNHPSGNTAASESDIKLTKKIKESGLILNIELIDHIIISNEGFYSFANEGML